jgi:hypothetical protein
VAATDIATAMPRRARGLRSDLETSIRAWRTRAIAATRRRERWRARGRRRALGARRRPGTSSRIPHSVGQDAEDLAGVARAGSGWLSERCERRLLKLESGNEVGVQGSWTPGERSRAAQWQVGRVDSGGGTAADRARAGTRLGGAPGAAECSTRVGRPTTTGPRQGRRARSRACVCVRV